MENIKIADTKMAHSIQGELLAYAEPSSLFVQVSSSADVSFIIVDYGEIAFFNYRGTFLLKVTTWAKFNTKVSTAGAFRSLINLFSRHTKHTKLQLDSTLQQRAHAGSDVLLQCAQSGSCGLIFMGGKDSSD